MMTNALSSSADRRVGMEGTIELPKRLAVSCHTLEG